MAKPCPHPRSHIRHVGGKLYRCSACQELRGTITGAELDAIRQQVAQLDAYNRAMRTSKARRKFIQTGEC